MSDSALAPGLVADIVLTDVCTAIQDGEYENADLLAGMHLVAALRAEGAREHIVDAEIVCGACDDVRRYANQLRGNPAMIPALDVVKAIDEMTEEPS